MDATTQAFVTEIVSRKIAENWLYWCLFLAASFLASFAGAYIKRRAENLATRDDFEDLKRQLAANTRVTEEIKAEIGHAEWKAREVNALLRSKLEELVESLWASNLAISTYVREVSGGEKKPIAAPELDRLRALSSIYFPEYSEAVAEYSDHGAQFMIWAMKRSGVVSDAKVSDKDRYANELRYNYAEFNNKVPELNKFLERIEKLAAERMKMLLE